MTSSAQDLSAQIADSLRADILNGDLIVDARLPSEAELAARFDVSRGTVREALKRLAAQSLIRTQRGHSGGAFVNRLTYETAREQQITTSTLLLTMNEVDVRTACEARYALERACAALAAKRHDRNALETMAAEIARQEDPDLSDEAFCASDVAFHRALVDGAANPVLSYQLAGAVEAMQPLMNMITYRSRERARITAIHRAIANALKAHDGDEVESLLCQLEAYTLELAQSATRVPRPA